MDQDELNRVRVAAAESLYADYLALLNSPTIEMGDKLVVVFKAELAPELKRRAKAYLDVIAGGKQE